jgi:hypothetical protein
MFKAFEDRTIADQTVPVAEFLHRSQSPLDGFEIGDLFLHLLELCVDTVDNIQTEVVVMTPQFQQFLDLRE